MEDEAAAPQVWVALIANPIKVGKAMEQIETWLNDAGEQSGWAPHRVFETTVEDSGVGQAHAALEQGATLVIAAGGDGTVRAVAGVLAGTDVPLGLLPMGTGNLLARNLSIPLNDVAGALEVAVSGQTVPIDVARLRGVRHGGEVIEEASVVMLGLGFDAEVVAGADDTMKRRFGWGAYVATGLPRLAGKRLPIRIWLDDRPPVRREVRTVIVASCGTLTGGVVLLPTAAYDDGRLDVLTVAPKGIAGWLSILGWVLSGSRKNHGLVRHAVVRHVRIQTPRPAPAQVDGDPIGDVMRLDVSVEERSLLVRAPQA